MDLSRSSRGRMLLLGVVALVAVAIAVPALAQNASETDAPSASNEGDRPRDERFVEACSAFAAALAEELDLPVDRVDDALPPSASACSRSAVTTTARRWRNGSTPRSPTAS